MFDVGFSLDCTVQCLQIAIMCGNIIQMEVRNRSCHKEKDGNNEVNAPKPKLRVLGKQSRLGFTFSKHKTKKWF